MVTSHHFPTVASVPVSLAPSTSNGQIIRYALIFETVANLGALGILLYYSSDIPSIMAAPVAGNIIARVKPKAAPAMTELTVHILCGSLIAFTVPILMSIPNTRRAIESRLTTYAMLLSGEIVLGAQLAFEAVTGRNRLNPDYCWLAITNLAPFALWRVFVIFVKPHWFGAYRDVAVKRA